MEKDWKMPQRYNNSSESPKFPGANYLLQNRAKIFQPLLSN